MCVAAPLASERPCAPCPICPRACASAASPLAHTRTRARPFVQGGRLPLDFANERRASKEVISLLKGGMEGVAKATDAGLLAA